LKIIKASVEDIQGIARIYIDSWRTTYYGLVSDDYLDSLSYQKSEQKWFHFFNSKNKPFVYIAINDTGKMIGFAAGKSIDNEKFEGELYALYLLKEGRGLGVGKRLVSVIAKHFKETDINSMIVWVMEQNKSGLGFYEHMGGIKYLQRKSQFGKVVVDDVAYGWNDITVLYMEE